MNRRFFLHDRLMVFSLIVMALLWTGCAATAQRKPSATREDAADKRKAMDLFIEGKVAEAKGDLGGAIASYIEAFQYDPKSEEIAEGIAKAFIKSRKPKAALYYAETAVSLNPKKAETWRLLQQLYQFEGRTADAVEALKTYIKLDPESGFIDRIWLARYYFEMGKNDEAREIILSSLKEGSASAEDISGAANLLAEEGYIEDAVSIYTTLVERDPMDVNAWITLGQLYEHVNHEDEARKAYEQGLEKNPGNLDLLVTLGNLNLTVNDWDAAIGYFEKANTTGVDVPKIRKTLAALYYYAGRDTDAESTILSIQTAGEDDALFYFSLGKAMNFMDRNAEAEEYFSQGFSKSLEGVPEDELLRAFAGYAQTLIQLGKHDDAIDLIREKASKIIDNNNALKMLEASIYNEMKRYEDAISIYEWLIASDPENIRYFLLLGQTYNSAKMYDKAEKTFFKIKDIDPENTDYLVQLSIVYDFSGQFKKAEKSLQDVLKKYPDHALALNNLAYMYIEHDTNIAKAIGMAETALEMEPRNGAYHDTVGWGYYKKGEYAKAKEHIESALKWEETPDKGVIYDHYGDIMAKMGMKNDAADAYRKAIELGEDSVKIQPKIDMLSR